MDIQELYDFIRRGYGGRALTALYTGKIDALLKDIFRSTFCSPESTANLCLIAIGGYGRGDLAPCSDIDIMLFAKDRSVSDRARELLYKLWDNKLIISHSFRTPSDCIAEAKKDVKTRTSLLEHRYIAGDAGLYEYFKDSVYPEIAFRDRKLFVMEKLREAEARHKKHGDSVFMLEPNVKEDRGGLRDVHNAIWLAAISHRVRHFDELAKILTHRDFERLNRAYDFLLKVRFCLHTVTGRRSDTLSFELHDQVAGLLNFKDSKKYLAAERFMRYFYLKASIINEVSSHIIDLCSLPYIIMPLHVIKKKITGDFTVTKNRIAYTGSGMKDGSKIIEAFSVAAMTGKKFSPLLKDEIKKNLTRVTKRTAGSRRAAGFFMNILNSGRAYETLSEMHYTGVLGRFIPEFGALSFLVVYEPYHRYTVDEHSLRAVANVEKLRYNQYKSLEHLSYVYNKISSKEALFLALLLHDIGKKGISRHLKFPLGLSERDHEGKGYREIKAILERFGLDAELRNRVEFLVKNHTLMSAFALKQEIDDPAVISMFVEEVNNIENLNALYLLTYADMAAVSSDFWTDWKSYQLRDIYESAFNYIKGFADKGPRAISRSLVLTDKERADLDDFVLNMPDKYALFNIASDVYRDYLMSKGIAKSGFVLNVAEGRGGTAEITVGAYDSPGLFSKIVGVLSGMGMNIFSARVYTGRNGLVIDKIHVSNYKDLWWDGIDQNLRENIENELLRDIKDEPEINRRRDWQSIPVTGRFMPFVEIDNETSPDSSILEFFAHDRFGLLYDISRSIYGLGIDIISARINTESGLAHDVFSIRKGGSKLKGIGVIELLSTLWEKLK